MQIFFYVIGWLSLRVIYWERKKRKEALEYKYGGHFINAGRILCLKFIGIILIILLTSLLFVVIGRAIYDSIN